MPMLGDIKMFAGPYAPEGWLVCDGRELLIHQYQALYSILGSRYGGDDRKVFHLPDLRDRLPVQPNDPRGVGRKGAAHKESSLRVTTVADEKAPHTPLTVPPTLAINFVICAEGGDYPPMPD